MRLIHRLGRYLSVHSLQSPAQAPSHQWRIKQMPFPVKERKSFSCGFLPQYFCLSLVFMIGCFITKFKLFLYPDLFIFSFILSPWKISYPQIIHIILCIFRVFFLSGYFVIVVNATEKAELTGVCLPQRGGPLSILPPQPQRVRLPAWAQDYRRGGW